MNIINILQHNHQGISHKPKCRVKIYFVDKFACLTVKPIIKYSYGDEYHQHTP